MLETVGSLVEHSDEVKVSAEIVDAEEVRDFVDKDYVYGQELSRSNDVFPVQSLIVSLGCLRFSFVAIFASTVDDAEIDYVFSADGTIHEGWGVDGFGYCSVTGLIECYVHGGH